MGVLGSGYYTEYFTTSQDLNTLKENDEIIRDKEWSARIGKSDAMFVPKDTHFHTQYEPDEFSMTVNIMPIGPITSNQYVLHQDKRRIHRILLPFNNKNNPLVAP